MNVNDVDDDDDDNNNSVVVVDDDDDDNNNSNVVVDDNSNVVDVTSTTGDDRASQSNLKKDKRSQFFSAYLKLKGSRRIWTNAATLNGEGRRGQAEAASRACKGHIRI